MRIYTRTGDDGSTSIFGGERLSKSDLRICSIGEIDELNSCLGMASSFSEVEDLKKIAAKLQHWLFDIGAILAMEDWQSDMLKLKEENIDWMEKQIDSLTEKITPLRNFILPGGSKAASFWHLARAVCRRAERSIVALKRDELKLARKYLNRMSDLLFVMARAENQLNGHAEILWQKEID